MISKNDLLSSKLAACFILIASFAGGDSYGQSSDAKEALAKPLIIQTVPISDLKTFLTHERPVRRAVFEEFLRAQETKQGDTSKEPLAIQVRKAVYEARLSADGNLQGTARIEIATRDSQSALLPTPDFQLAFQSLKWKDRDDPVIWGLGSDQRLLLVVPQSGELEFSWSARTQSRGAQRFDFDLGLLRATNADFTLLAPRKWKVTFDGKLPPDSSVEDGDGVRHKLAFGASRRLQIRLENTASTSVGKPTYWVRQMTRLDVARQGIDLVADLEIEPIGLPLSAIPIRIDSHLQLISAKLGDQSLNWTSHQEGKEQVVELQFEPPLVESGRKVRIEARVPLADEKMISLPRVRPFEAVLREAEIELHTSPPLEMVGVELEGARFSDSGPVISTRGGEVRRFRLTNPAADIRCAFRSPEFRGRVRYGAKLTVSDATFELDARARLTVDSGESFDLSSSIPAGWVVESVESMPPGAIESWSVTPRDSMQQLSLRLSRTLSTKSTLNLHIAAHLPRVGKEALSTKLLFFAGFEQMPLEVGYLQLNSTPGIRTDAEGDNAIRLNPTTLSLVDKGLFPEGSSGVIYSLSPQREFATLHSTSQADFRADLASRILLESDRIISRHRLTITPQRRQLDRLLVRIHPGAGASLSFDLEESATQRLNSQLISTDPQGDLWELRFSEPFTSDFSVVATNSSPVNSTSTLQTLTCEGAALQESNLVVFSTNDQGWEVNVNGAQNVGMKSAAPAPLVELASVRYGLTDHPKIEVSRKEARVDALQLWAWIECRTTLIGEEQQEIHEAAFRLEGNSPSEATFQLPPGGELLEVRLNGEVTHSYRTAAQSLRIPIPQTIGEQLLQIRIAANRAVIPLGTTPVAWQGVVAQFPVLSKSWTIWTPPGIAVEAENLLPNFAGCFSLFDRPSSKNRDDWMEIWFTSNKSLSKGSSPIDESQLRIAGWRSTQIHTETDEVPRVFQYDDSSWRLAGWCAVALSLLTFYSLLGNGGWSRRIGLIVILSCAIASILVSGPGKLLFSGGFLGGVLGALLLGLCRCREVLWPSKRAVHSLSRMGAALLIWLCIYHPLIAQAPLEPEMKRGAVSARNVIDPVDPDGKPVGDFVYVSPELFEELALSSTAHASEPCLLQAVRYRVSRASNPETGSILLVAEYTYFAGADAQSVAIPTSVQGTSLNGDECYVDGERRRLPVRRDGRMAQVELLGRGVHTIRVELRVPLRSDKDVSVAIWKALSLGNQELEVETDSSLVWTLNGEALNHDPVRRIAKIHLSPGREVQLGLRRISFAAATMETSLRHDAWITLGPGSIGVEHAVRVAPDSAGNSLVFELDEDMSLDSVLGPNRRELTAVSLGDRRYRVPLESPVADEASLRVQCSAKSGLSLSRLNSTGISFPNAKVTSTRIGVTASAEFTLQPESRAGTLNVPVADFVQSWPAGKLPPQLVIAVEANRTWNIDVSPFSPQTNAKQQTEYLVLPNEIQIHWEANVTSGSDPVSFYSLRVPTGLRIESVSVSEGSANRLVRFSRTSPERLSIFMRTATIEPRQIQLRGALDFDASAPASLPTLFIEGSNLASQTIRVFCGFDALVEVKSLKGLRAIESSPLASAKVSTLAPQSSRPLGSFEVISSPQLWEALLTVSPNLPKVSHQSIAQFELKDSKWRMRQDFKVNIQGGVADELELELPPGLREPYTIEPAEPFRVVQGDGAPVRIRISPTQPWKDNKDIRLSGDYMADVGAPELVLSPARLLHSSMQLGQLAATKQAVNGDFAWKGDGAEEMPPPEAIDNADSYQWFKQRDEQSTIRLQQRSAAAKQTSLQLEGEVLLSDHRYLAALTWVWSSSSSQEVTLTAPEGVQVIRVRVIGSSAKVTQVSKQVWRLTSVLGNAPPTLEVVCAGAYSPRTAISLPAMGGATTKKSILTLNYPRDLKPSEPAGERSVNRHSATLARLRMLDQLNRDVQPVLPTLGLEESIAWRRNWVTQWETAKAMMMTESHLEPATDASSIWLRDSEADHAQMISEVESSSAEANRKVSPPAASILLAIAQSSAMERGDVAYFVSEGKPHSIQFERREMYTANFAIFRAAIEESPWIIFVGGGGLLLLMFLGSSPRRREVTMAVTPIAAWVGLGTAWWFWFSPAWFGPLMAGAALLFLIGTLAKRTVSALR